MDDLYSLEYLIKVFSNHVEKTEKYRIDHPEHFPLREGDEFPEFNICKAFLTFATEIENLKNPYGNRLDRKSGYLHD